MARARTGWNRSLGWRLFLWLTGITVAAFAAYTAVTLSSLSHAWREQVEANAARFCNLIQHATHHDMMENRKEDVHDILVTIAREPGVDGVRIYDKAGVIIDSADLGDVGLQADMHAEQCVICHAADEPLRAVSTSERSRVFERADGSRVLGLISPIENAPECSNAACHAHPAEQTVLGVLDVTMSMAAADARLAEARRDKIVGALIVGLLVATFSAVFIYRTVTKPVHRLIDGADRIAHGDLGARISVDSTDEMGRLAAAFNSMTADLARARDEITSWSDRVERKLVEKTDALGRAQRQVSHVEKMASLGKLAATVAHELNNPLAGILNYARLVERDLERAELPENDRTEMQRCLTIIRREASRSGDIVRNLLLFARPSARGFVSQAVRPILERSVDLVRHHLEIHDIATEIDLPDPELELRCDPDQVQQALVALLVNAVEAMHEGGGRLRVVTAHDEQTVRISVSDSGPGIPPEIAPHVFEPFFTTKDETHGVGLGLAVVYGIAQRHGGRVDLESRPGEGATFTLVLSRRPAAEQRTHREAS